MKEFLITAGIFFALGTWFGMARLGVWYTLYKIGDYETRERRRRIRG